MQEIISFIVETASAWGYLGIIILMTLESCFIPYDLRELFYTFSK